MRATPIHDAMVEIHSHHSMRAYFSSTDDRDETGRRVYGVLGSLDSPHPEIALRVATGCQPHAVEPVPFAQVFAADLDGFRDVHFSSAAERPSPADSRALPTNPWRLHHRASVLTALVLDMAEDLAGIREMLEPGRHAHDNVASSPWVVR